MAKPNRLNSVQDPFLNWMIESGVLLDIWMDSGQHLEGVVGGYDAHTILLRSVSGKKERLLQKALISALRPKESPAGRMERRITRRRRKHNHPLERFIHPIDPDISGIIFEPIPTK